MTPEVDTNLSLKLLPRTIGFLVWLEDKKNDLIFDYTSMNVISISSTLFFFDIINIR